ncbi:hypothetical protein CEXT_362301 [Caerostris extrusa]|uniref:Uncharacterized protein n=1 Tax=Caerostris extrusa TaxID=172846 RepID=A0AAV4NBC3_CAEEX|nr:hypothetical protein CEXT_362301 [Caerostris extrusa]
MMHQTMIDSNYLPDNLWWIVLSQLSDTSSNEIQFAIDKLKNHKTAGPNSILSELLKFWAIYASIDRVELIKPKTEFNLPTKLIKFVKLLLSGPFLRYEFRAETSTSFDANNGGDRGDVE